MYSKKIYILTYLYIMKRSTKRTSFFLSFFILFTYVLSEAYNRWRWYQYLYTLSPSFLYRCIVILNLWVIHILIYLLWVKSIITKDFIFVIFIVIKKYEFHLLFLKIMKLYFLFFIEWKKLQQSLQRMKRYTYCVS